MSIAYKKSLSISYERAETQAIASGLSHSIQQSSEENRATLAEYVNKTIPKDKRLREYTAEDIAKDTDGITMQLAVLQFAGNEFINYADAIASLEADKAQEGAIGDVVNNIAHLEAQNEAYKEVNKTLNELLNAARKRRNKAVIELEELRAESEKMARKAAQVAKAEAAKVVIFFLTRKMNNGKMFLIIKPFGDKMSIKIGNTTLKYGLFLAPMAGFTDYSFRAICREHGAEYTVSEMVSAKALCYEQISKKNSDDAYKTASLCKIDGEELPMSIQLFGSEPQYVAEAARMIEDSSYKKCTANTIPTAIDINMGCPMHKIVGNGEGSALMKNPALAASIVNATAKSLKNIPVTVKIRAGWDSESKNAAEMAKMLEDAGASLICVHARTREQMYNPGIDISVIEKVKNAVKIPVVGNGDILSAADAVNMIEKTGCDGIMIGRGAIGNPWLFEEISAHLDGREYTSPTLKERLEACVRHIRMIRDDKGEITGGAEIKKHAVMYIKGVRSAASVRDAIMKSHSTAEIEEIIERLIEE